ncbi:MAG: DinB family protein, partial [Saprospiraceae bacterium]|nr:DinB family protein [Saprospiraceae bacterium]
WTVKELLLHMIDTERIFAYRALRIARSDLTPMAGFDQDDYVPYSNANERSSTSIVSEYSAVRQATIQLFKNFTDAMYAKCGTASERPFTPLALGFIIAGHEIHHLRILMEKYQISNSGY